jgi:hypothetical protein
MTYTKPLILSTSTATSVIHNNTGSKLGGTHMDSPNKFTHEPAYEDNE